MSAPVPAWVCASVPPRWWRPSGPPRSRRCRALEAARESPWAMLPAWPQFRPRGLRSRPAVWSAWPWAMRPTPLPGPSHPGPEWPRALQRGQLRVPTPYTQARLPAGRQGPEHRRFSYPPRTGTWRGARKPDHHFTTLAVGLIIGQAVCPHPIPLPRWRKLPEITGGQLQCPRNTM